MKQGDVQQQPAEIPLGFHLSPVDVHHIAQQLEGVKADADGQGDLGNHAGEPEPLLGLAQKKSGVFEEGQQPQINDAAQGQKELAFPGTSVFVDTLGQGPIHKAHEHQQQNEERLSPGVKDQGKQDQHRIFSLDAAGDRVDQHLQRKENA